MKSLAHLAGRPDERHAVLQIFAEGPQAHQGAVERVGQRAARGLGAQHGHAPLVAHERRLDDLQRFVVTRRHVDHLHAPRLALQRFDLRGRPADGLRLLAIDLTPPHQLLHRHEERREGGQAQARRRAHALLAVGGDVTAAGAAAARGAGAREALRRMEAALEVEGLAAPALPHQRDAFIHAHAGIAALRLEGLIVLQGPAAADADVEAAAAHHVEHGELLGEVHRMVQGQQAHPHAQAQGGRARGDVRGQHRRRRAEAVVVEVVLGEPDRAIAERLGGEHLLQGGFVDRLLAPRLVPLHEKEQPELHHVLPVPENRGAPRVPRGATSAGAFEERPGSPGRDERGGLGGPGRGPPSN